MSEPFIGQIIMFGGNFAPRGWAFCEGQTLAIDQNTALFSILGTTYGGDGRTSFALPDLRGRVPVNPGSSPGLSAWSLGEKRGEESTTLNPSNLPRLNLTVTGEIKVRCADQGADTHVGKGNPLAKNARDVENNNQTIEIYKDQATATFNDDYVIGGLEYNLAATNTDGNNFSFNNIQPSLAVHFIIALQGWYPSRN